MIGIIVRGVARRNVEIRFAVTHFSYHELACTAVVSLNARAASLIKCLGTGELLSLFFF